MKLIRLLSVILLFSFLTACLRPAGQLPLVLETPPVLPTEAFTIEPSQIPSPTATFTPQPFARIQRGDQAIQNGDWEAALREYRDALNVSPALEIQAAALLGIGRAQFLDGDYQAAIQSLTALLETYPDSQQATQAHFTLAQAYTALEGYDAAFQAYTAYLESNPGLIDAYILELRGDLSTSAGNYLAAAQDYRSAFNAPSLLDRTFLEMKEARAYSLGGDNTTALALYDDLYTRTSDESTRALILLRKGQIYASLGQTELTQAAYLEMVNSYPTYAISYQALLDLVESGVVVDELKRGLVDYHAGQYGVALAALDRYLQNAPADPATARYYSGLTNRALGGYDGAILEWEKVIDNFPDSPYWDEAWEERAYTQWYYLDQYQQAIDGLLTFAEAAATHPRAAEFLFDAAKIAELSGDLELASSLFERVANLYPEYSEAGRSLFLSGITRYRLGDYAGAFLSFERLAGISSNPGDRAMAHLWIGKAQQKLGDEGAAQSSWELAASLDPTGYYSVRAADLIGQRPAFSPPAGYDLGIDLQQERLLAEEWMRETFSLDEATNLSALAQLSQDPRLLRGTELWKLGLYNEARSELEDLRLGVSADPVLTFHLAGYLADLGLYRSATLASRQVLDLAGMDDAGTLNAPAYFNHLRFGSYYKDLIIPVAEEYNFNPLLIFSLIRQESLFESFVRSTAQAQGLMQIMPATGAEIAEDLEWPADYSQQDLSRPLVNVNFGVDYLNSQRTAFDGNLYATLAAYNGGPGNSIAWLKLAPDDPDLFLEIIRFGETRDYIRRIYEVFNIYRLLYDRSL